MEKSSRKGGWSGGAMSFFEQAEVADVLGPIDNAKHRDTMPLANCTWGFGVGGTSHDEKGNVESYFVRREYANSNPTQARQNICKRTTVPPA
jgi:hypothetical protein